MVRILGEVREQVIESMRQRAHISANWEAKISDQKSGQAISHPLPGDPLPPAWPYLLKLLYCLKAAPAARRSKCSSTGAYGVEIFHSIFQS